MDQEELKKRTKTFGLRILNLADALPKSAKGRTVAEQIIRSGMSVGANYRAACRARSKAEFVSKLGTVIEEADESAFWIEVIIEAKLLKENLVASLLTEANEIIAIMTSSRKTAQSSLNRQSTIGNRQS